MSYAAAKAARDALQSDVDLASAVLSQFPRGPLGMTPDHVRATPAWRTARARYDTAFAILRAFNASFTRAYGAEITADRH